MELPPKQADKLPNGRYVEFLSKPDKEGKIVFFLYWPNLRYPLHVHSPHEGPWRCQIFRSFPENYEVPNNIREKQLNRFR